MPTTNSHSPQSKLASRVKTDFIRRGNGKVQFKRTGTGTPLVLVCTLAGAWAGQMGPLSKSHEVITYDMRGFGDSTNQDGYISHEAHADDLACLIDTLQLDNPVIVGLSHGGIVLQHFAKRHLCEPSARKINDPELSAKKCNATAAYALQRSVSGLMFVATHGKAFGQTRLLLDLLNRCLAKEEADQFWDILRTFLFSETKFEKMMRREKHLKSLMFNQFTVACLHDIYCGALTHDASGWFNTLNTPTAVVSGNEDILFPHTTTEYLVEQLPKCEWSTLPCAHLPPVEAKQEFNALLLDFCQRAQKHNT